MFAQNDVAGATSKSLAWEREERRLRPQPYLSPACASVPQEKQDPPPELLEVVTEVIQQKPPPQVRPCPLSCHWSWPEQNCHLSHLCPHYTLNGLLFFYPPNHTSLCMVVLSSHQLFSKPHSGFASMTRSMLMRLFFFFKTSSGCVTQAGPKLLGSSNPWPPEQLGLQVCTTLLSYE
jgi:hypothetical protein